VELNELQALFWTTARGHLDARAVNAAFRSDHRLDAASRMAVYRDMYFARQIGVLAETFPALAARLGTTGFETLSREYLREHPSEDPAIERVGFLMPGFVAGYTGKPALGELATLEWLANQALLAPEERLASAADVAPDRWPEVRLRITRSLGTARVSREAYAEWSGDSAHGTEIVTVAVWRRGHRVRHVELAEEEMSALDRARDGARFDAICAELGEVQHAYRVLRAFFERGFVTALELG
jgi:hypothetical protein